MPGRLSRKRLGMLSCVALFSDINTWCGNVFVKPVDLFISSYFFHLRMHLERVVVVVVVVPHFTASVDYNLSVTET